MTERGAGAADAPAADARSAGPRGPALPFFLDLDLACAGVYRDFTNAAMRSAAILSFSIDVA